MHVREGNQAIAQLLKGSGKFAKWAAKFTYARGRGRTVGNMLFSIESGLVDRRLRWDAADRLRSMGDDCFGGVDPMAVADGLEVLREDLPTLNEARRHVVASNFR